jgi:hypothetical protein
LPGIANAPASSVDKLDSPIDTSILEKVGRSTRSEGIALVRAQGLDADDDDDPALENIPTAGAPTGGYDDPHHQAWGWGSTCHRRSKNFADVNRSISDHTRNDLRIMSKPDVF